MENKCNLLADRYKIGKKLGQGTSCMVRVAKNIQSGEEQRFAIKIMKSLSKYQSLYKNEVKCLQKVPKHKNIINLIEADEGKIEGTKQDEPITVDFIVFEYCKHGELFDFVLNNERFSEAAGRFFFKQFIDGLDHLHQNNVGHRDIKLENILLTKDLTVKISDFGFASPLIKRDGSDIMTSVIGTTSTMAPEILLKKPYRG